MRQISKNKFYWIAPVTLMMILSCSVRPDTKQSGEGASLTNGANATTPSVTIPVTAASDSDAASSSPSLPVDSIPTTLPSTTPLPEENKLTWDYVNNKVFAANCISCHSVAGGNKGRVNLETYANVKARIDDIENEVIIEQAMPPDGPVDSETADVLKAWIDAGIPETAPVTPPTVPTPTPIPTPAPVDPVPAPVDPIPTPAEPVPAPVVIDYAFVNKNVLAPFCLSCHSVAGGNKGRINLETFANVTKNLRKIKSEAITQQSMPPSGPLPSDAMTILSKWISAGAPQTVPAQ